MIRFLRRPGCYGAALLFTSAAAAADLPAVADPSAPAAPLDYRSVFSGYTKPVFGPAGDWKQANQVVRDVGGFAGVMKDGAGDGHDQSNTPADAQPAARPGSAAGHGGHTGHGR